MLKKTLYAFLFLVCLTGCKSDHKEFTIEGKVPSTKYDGEWIYLVPAEGANSSNVDSTQVKNASFTFKGNIERIAIIRTKPVLRLSIQELLVVTESGNIKVTLNSASSAHGTPQNDALQLWKEEKEKNMTAYNFIRKGLQTVSGKDSLRWMAQMNALQKRERIYNERFLKEQGNNTLGTFIKKMVGVSDK
jgi:hypothetical protein